ncbi:MAG: hypothetical protein ACK41U_11590 [Paracoccus sp. (in: a-proteobacteria)]|uniref:hypothetical protein n=1 Tax=Paracoccus sp. TaxID=267 RepID=UPI00391D862A
MNMNRIISMFTRLVMRRAMNWGLNKGISQVSRKGTRARPEDDHLTDDGTAPRTPAGAKKKQSRDIAKRARTASRMTRR